MMRPHEMRWFYQEFPAFRDISMYCELGERAWMHFGGENARSFYYRVTDIIGRIRNAGIDGLLQRIRSNGKLAASNGHMERVS